MKVDQVELRDVIGRRRQDAVAWLAVGQRARWVGGVLLAVLLAAGLLLPPLSLADRLATPGYRRVTPGGGDLSVPAEGVPTGGAQLEVPRTAILRSTRVRLRARTQLPGGPGDLPAGAEQLGPAYTLDFRGPLPSVAYLRAPLALVEGEQSFIDPYGWDSASSAWRWLAPAFPQATVARVALPLSEFMPEIIIFTRATEGRPTVSAVLEPPPNVLPAAAAELPVLELRAFGLDGFDGTILRRPVQPVSRRSLIWAVVDNLDGDRVRVDLVTNLLARPEHRHAHRAAIVAAARADGYDGIVLDYRSVPDDMHAALAEMSRLLYQDLDEIGVDLAVTVPPPVDTGDGWDGGAVRWRALGDGGVAVRIRLPADRPLAVASLDGMVRWALARIDRRRLQLAVPVHGVDVVDGIARPIGYGEALGRMLDLARSDAPARISPGTTTAIELPTIAAAELGRDADTGMWRFYWWDANRRQHTIWLNDAEGLAPGFEIASRYRLGRIALDGVAAGLDPLVWRMVKAYVESGIIDPPPASYRLQWQLVDSEGAVIQEAVQPLDEISFQFRAPPAPGDFELSVNLLTGDGDLAAPGHAAAVRVAPPPPASPTPTPIVFRLDPTPESYQTVPPPSDELRVRTPVRVDGGTPDSSAITGEHDATFDAASGVLRAGPAVTEAEKTDLRPGDQMLILGRSEDDLWLNVRMLNTGMEGWVLAELVLLREVQDEAEDEDETGSATP